MSTAATVSAMQLRQSIGALLNRVQYGGERIVVARQGKPVAALVGWPELQRISAWRKSTSWPWWPRPSNC